MQQSTFTVKVGLRGLLRDFFNIPSIAAWATGQLVSHVHVFTVPAPIITILPYLCT